MQAKAVPLTQQWSWITWSPFAIFPNSVWWGKNATDTWIHHSSYCKQALRGLGYRNSSWLWSAWGELMAGLGPKWPVSHIRQYHCRQRKLRNQIFRHYKEHYCVNTPRVLKGEVQSCMVFLQVHSFKHENNYTDVNELLTNLKLNACFDGLRPGHNLTKFSPWFLLIVQLGQSVPRPLPFAIAINLQRVGPSHDLKLIF